MPVPASADDESVDAFLSYRGEVEVQWDKQHPVADVPAVPAPPVSPAHGSCSCPWWRCVGRNDLACTENACDNLG